MKGLDVTDKAQRVGLYHKNTIHAVKEIIEASGLKSTDDLMREHIFRRVEENKVMTFEEIYPLEN
jgi:glutamate synthase domain-containing protein 2